MHNPQPPLLPDPRAAFPYPIALTMWHMFFCASLASLIIRAGYVEPVKMGTGGALMLGPCKAQHLLWLPNKGMVGTGGGQQCTAPVSANQACRWMT